MTTISLDLAQGLFILFFISGISLGGLLVQTYHDKGFIGQSKHSKPLGD